MLNHEYFRQTALWSAIPALATAIDKRVAMLDALPTLKAKREACPIMSPRKGNSSPVQTGMLPLNAIAWQAAMVLCGVRKILGTQSKLSKAQEKIGIVNLGVTMSSANEAADYLRSATDKRNARFNACVGATAACTIACVGHATGQGRQLSSWIARVGKTVAMFHDPTRFLNCLNAEVKARQASASKRDLGLAIRANVATDFPWLAGVLALDNSSVDFYDYTAITSAARRNDGVRRVYSLKDGAKRRELALNILREGRGLAVVFNVASDRAASPTAGQDHSRGYDLPPAIPVEGLGLVPVLPGDDHDLWFAMETYKGETVSDLMNARRPFIVGLKFKATTHEQSDAVLDSDFAKGFDVFAAR